MCHGFQITYFNIQQLSIVLMMALLEHFNLEVNEKVSFRSNNSKLGMLFLTNIASQRFYVSTTRNMQNFTV